MLNSIYKKSNWLNVPNVSFFIPFLFTRLDEFCKLALENKAHTKNIDLLSLIENELIYL